MAKNSKEINTEIVYSGPDGNVVFENIEQASEALGLSVATIKLRCNKPPAPDKSGYTLQWVNDSTKRHYRAKRNKHKGSSFELEICKKLSECGYTECVTSRSESKRADDNKIDIVDPSGKLPINIQAKYTQNLPNYFKLRDICTDKDKPYVIMWKKTPAGNTRSPGTVAVIPSEFFYKLLTAYNETT